MSEPREERCENCRFCAEVMQFSSQPPYERPYRECRVNPPVVSQASLRAFPLLKPNDWCGKFEPKPAPTT